MHHQCVALSWQDLEPCFCAFHLHYLRCILGISWSDPVPSYPASMLFSNSSAGLGIYTVCWMGRFQWFFCMRNWPLARGHEDTWRASAKGAWGRCTWMLTGGKMLLMIAHAGDAIYTKVWSKGRRNGGLLLWRSVLKGKKTTRQHWGKRLYMHLLQLRLSVPCEPVQP